MEEADAEHAVDKPPPCTGFVLELRQYNRSVNLLKHSINHAVCSEDFHGVCAQECAVHCVSGKASPTFSYSSRKHCRIFKICGTRVTEKLSNQQMS